MTRRNLKTAKSMEKTIDDQYLELEEEIAHCNTVKYGLQMKQIKLLAKKYAPLMDKKVRYVIKPLFEGDESTVRHGYLRGFRLVQGRITPMFSRVNKDGSASRQIRGCTYSIGEIESITLE